MNLDALYSSYSVLYPFTYGQKTILVCWDEKQFKYCYFESKDDKFFPVKSKALDSFLTPYTKPEVFLESNEDGKLDDASIENLKNEVFKNIISFLNGCNDDIINKAKKNFETLVVKYDEIKDCPNVSGLYFPLTNTILIKNNIRASQLAHVLTHEMIHCVSNTNINKLGLRYFETLKYLNKSTYYKNSNSILNEAFTEYFAQKIKPTNAYYYTVPVEMLKSLMSFCDETKLKQYFFDSNIKDFVNYLIDNFKQSTGEIARLSILFDACQRCYDATLNAQNSAKVQNVNFEASTIALCNCITKMVVDKYKTDNTLKIEDLSFDDIFKAKTQKLLLNYKIDINKIKSFFKFYKNQKYIKYSTSPLDFQYFSNKFMDYFINNLPLPVSFPEEFKCFEVYQQTLSPSTEVIIGNIEVFTKQKMFERLFNPDYNYLPQNENAQIKIAMHYIEIMDMYDFDITKHMNPNIVIKAISKNIVLFNKMCEKDIYFLLNYQRNLPQNLQKAPVFYKTLINQLVEEKNQNALQILTRYVYTMDDKTIKLLLKKTEFLSYLQNSKLLNEKDFMEYKNDLISYLKGPEYVL